MKDECWLLGRVGWGLLPSSMLSSSSEKDSFSIAQTPFMEELSSEPMLAKETHVLTYWKLLMNSCQRSSFSNERIIKAEENLVLWDILPKHWCTPSSAGKVKCITCFKIIETNTLYKLPSFQGLWWASSQLASKYLLALSACMLCSTQEVEMNTEWKFLEKENLILFIV